MSVPELEPIAFDELLAIFVERTGTTVDIEVYGPSGDRIADLFGMLKGWGGAGDAIGLSVMDPDDDGTAAGDRTAAGVLIRSDAVAYRLPWSARGPDSLDAEHVQVLSGGVEFVIMFPWSRAEAEASSSGSPDDGLPY